MQRTLTNFLTVLNRMGYSWIPVFCLEPTVAILLQRRMGSILREGMKILTRTVQAKMSMVYHPKTLQLIDLWS